MVTPRTSLGSMSLVNWSRWKLQDTARASACARVVLPTPGTSSMSRWPRASRHTSDSLTASGLPRRTEPSARSSSASLGVENPAGASVDSRWGITFQFYYRLGRIGRRTVRMYNRFNPMPSNHRRRRVRAWLLPALLAEAPAFAQVDFSGEWAP